MPADTVGRSTHGLAVFLLGAEARGRLGDLGERTTVARTRLPMPFVAPDARSRLDELDSLLVDEDDDFVTNPGNLLVSQLWERLGDDQRAWNAVRRRYVGPGGSTFASARLRAVARIGERLGKRNEAISALRTYVAIRAEADAAHQADLQSARATLSRLEKEAHGR
jgi:hypothetical protein